MHALFFLSAIAACMTAITTAFGDPVEIKAVAVCKDGKCVMTEEDFKRMQEFIAATQKVAQTNTDIERSVNEKLDELTGALETCKERQRKWKS